MNQPECRNKRSGFGGRALSRGWPVALRGAAARTALVLCWTGPATAAQVGSAPPDHGSSPAAALAAIGPQATQRPPADTGAQPGEGSGDDGGIASAPPPNDDCWTAQPFACPGTFIADLTTATLDANDPNVPCYPGGGPGFANVWYTFVATTNEIKVRTCATTFAGADSIIALYAGACGNLIELCCNDDGCGNGNLLSEFCCRNLVVGQTYYLQVGCVSNASRGLYTVDILCACESPGENPCPWECPPGAIQENEPNNCGVPVDSFNGGCNNNPFADFPIECGQTICATYAAAGGVRDTDWYRMCLLAPAEVVITLTVDVPSIAAVVDLSGGCGALSILEFVRINACETVRICTTWQGCLWLVVAPDTFAGVPCPSRYMFTVECRPDSIGACCLNRTCIPNVAECDCVDAGGLFYRGQTCAQIADYCNCDIQCPPEGVTLENEPGGCGIPVDTFNGGCNAATQAWSPIHCNETICGQYGAVGGVQDIDAYLLSIVGRQTVTVTFTGELPSFGVFTNFLGFGVPCGDLDFDDLRMTPNPCASFSWTRTLNTGSYVIAVSPGWNVLNVGCPFDYILSVQCVPAGGRLSGDTNCDGRVDNFDIDCFTIAIGAGEAAWHEHCNADGGCDFQTANDVNGDGLVNNFDIDAFVQLISGG